MGFSNIPPGLLEARYYETYYFADVISNILDDPSPYVRNLDNFYGDLAIYSFLEPFPRYSYFHRFIEYLIGELIDERQADFNLDRARERATRFSGAASEVFFDHTKPPIERAFLYHRIQYQTFRDWLQEHRLNLEEATDDDVCDYYSDLRVTQDYTDLVEAMVEETFFIMFLNRKAMRDFNRLMAGPISDIGIDEAPPDVVRHLKVDGILKRAHIPAWAKKAVFFRERGKCALTRKDLSGLLSTLNDSHFDHIVPLSKGGLNDVTNLQLLAADVNVTKSNSHDRTSLVYERWY